MKRKIYEIDIIPYLVRLKTNVKKIPNFSLLSYKITENRIGMDMIKNKSKIEIEYIVNDKFVYQNDTLKLNNGDKLFKRIGNNKVYFQRSIGLGLSAKLLLEINNKYAKIIVNNIYHRLNRMSINHLYSPGWHLLDVIDIKLLNIGYCLLHSAAFVYKNKGILLVGLPNTGKTSTAYFFVSKCMAKYIAEDISVTNGKEVFTCPYTFSFVKPSVRSKKLKIYEKMVDFFPLLDHFRTPPLNSSLDIFGKDSLCLKEKIEYVFILNKGQRFVHPLDADIAKSKILLSNRAEFTYSNNPLLLSSQLLGLKVDVFKAIEKEAQIIESLVRNSHVYYLSGDTDYFIESIRSIVQ